MWEAGLFQRLRQGQQPSRDGNRGPEAKSAASSLPPSAGYSSPISPGPGAQSQLLDLVPEAFCPLHVPISGRQLVLVPLVLGNLPLDSHSVLFQGLTYCLVLGSMSIKIIISMLLL